MEKVDCGELLHNHLTKRKMSQKALAEKIKVPEGTVSSWITKKDIKVSNLTKVCNVLNIKLWQFFAPDDLILPEFFPEQKAFFTAFADMPEELQDKALDVIIRFLEAYNMGKEARYR